VTLFLEKERVGMEPTGQRASLIFIGQRNFYTEYLAEWLAELTDLKGIIWTASERRRLRSRMRFVWKRSRRLGLFRVLSESLNFIAVLPLRHRNGIAMKRLIKEARKALPADISLPEALEVPSLRASGVQPYLDERRPDIILTQCINEIVPESVYSLPKMGSFVYHEGIVPEYRGKYGTYWAIFNGDYNKIGASLIKVGPGIDLGQVAFTEYVWPQGRGRDANWWEHEVLFLALPRLKQWIQDVSAGRVQLQEQKGKYSPYSLPRFGDLLKRTARVEAYERWLVQNHPPAPTAPPPAGS
jgi:hypothetical protein